MNSAADWGMAPVPLCSSTSGVHCAEETAAQCGLAGVRRPEQPHAGFPLEAGEAVALELRAKGQGEPVLHQRDLVLKESGL